MYPPALGIQALGERKRALWSVGLEVKALKTIALNGHTPYGQRAYPAAASALVAVTLNLSPLQREIYEVM